MIENIDFTLIDWSRGQFALTAMFHWLFVPLTLGLSFIIAIMETIYYKTQNEEWKRITKFWMTLFGINFAIGVATGIILEFQFGTNWSNYSWFVGDIFGAPLAIEGIMAFFMESTFVAVMFFGWNKVSKKFHLVSTWLVAVGANLSALWILVANAWMQNPVGMEFNPDTARNEMVNFWDVALSPIAVNKFLHTISSSFTLGAIFVVGISAWYLLKKRHIQIAKKSIVVASVFGLLAIAHTILTGDGSAHEVAQKQPMKFAAMEGLYQGQSNAGLVAIGLMSENPQDPDYENVKDFHFKIEIPSLLSYMAYGSFDSFVPGIKDLIEGNEKEGFIPVTDKVKMGKKAINALTAYKQAKKTGDEETAAKELEVLNANYQYFGYGYFENNTKKLIPSVPMSFYSFHIMVMLGGWFLLFFMVMLWLAHKERLEKSKWWLRAALFTMPLAYVASETGWLVAEMGRQPWVVQDLMPTLSAVTNINVTSVQITFWLFAVVFTALFIAEIKIMLKQINIGPKEGGQ